jgi:hypothetical protein
MRRRYFGAGALCALAIAVVTSAALGGAAGAAASQPREVVIHETTTFAPNHQPPVGAFTAEGLPGCSSGSFSDQPVSFSPNGTRLILDRSYVCAEGGTLTARVALHLGAIDSSGLQTADGTWRIVAGTGALADAAGSGSASGLNSGCAPVGVVFGECAFGTGTTRAWIH